MGDMNAAHDEATIADSRGIFLTGGDGAMHRRGFTDRHVIADDKLADFFIRVNVLGWKTDESGWADLAVFSDFRFAMNVGVFMDDGAGPDGDRAFDDAVRFDEHVVSKFGVSINHGGWMYFGHDL
jgi:hypothetical protein